MGYDTAAAPLLTAVMAAAGYHDQERCLTLLTEAEQVLGARRHKAAADIARARDAALAGNWQLVWAAAHQAICGLTWAFPPDLATCPPRPRDTPYPTEQVACGCGATVPAGVGYCTGCGTPAP